MRSLRRTWRRWPGAELHHYRRRIPAVVVTDRAAIAPALNLLAEPGEPAQAVPGQLILAVALGFEVPERDDFACATMQMSPA
jgi:hypothetical protein